MSETFAVMAFFLSLGALLLGSEIIRRFNSQHNAIRALSERLIAAEIRMAEQEQSQDENLKTLQTLERRAQEGRTAPATGATAAPVVNKGAA